MTLMASSSRPDHLQGCEDGFMWHRPENISEIKPGNRAMPLGATRIHNGGLQDEIVFTASVNRYESFLVDADSIVADGP